ncbi:MAG: aminotransferase class I/II-fold pyridoxal phosphate-dependent enzyme, partial [archaeon GB-1867-097]|nr:aminotransferase class I/II-fold pyridoxal phosphate-dependent enzyme [Candidatus Culexmicrobium thermophilum]
IDEYGVGAGAVRPISGTTDLHMEAEEKIAKFKHREAAILFQSGYTANVGTIPAIVGVEDAILSEELNHGSIIDGCRLTKAKRLIYKHLDMDDLKAKLIEAKESRRRLIVTDGVFSMDGDIAPLDKIVELAEKYDAIVYVDDAHGEGVLGDHGRGIADHFKLHDRVDIEMGTLSKAFGVIGGYIAGSSELVEYLRQRARPYLLSSAPNPPDVAAIIAAIDLLEESDEPVRRLWRNTEYFQSELKNRGFNIGNTKTPITPVMIGDEKKTQDLVKMLFSEYKIFVQAVVYPWVPRGTARIRFQPNACHSIDNLKYVIDSLEEASRKLGIIG